MPGIVMVHEVIPYGEIYSHRSYQIEAKQSQRQCDSLESKIYEARSARQDHLFTNSNNAHSCTGINIAQARHLPQRDSSLVVARAPDSSPGRSPLTVQALGYTPLGGRKDRTLTTPGLPGPRP